MADQQHRPSWQRRDCRVDQFLGLAVDGRGGLIQHKNGCVPHQGSREGNTLSLTSGEPAALRTDLHRPSCRGSLDKRRNVCDPRSLKHVGRVHGTVADVLGYRTAKQVWILKNCGNRRAKRCQAELTNVDTINTYVSTVRLSEAQQQ